MKILIVEDEPKVASFIKKGLEENGFGTEMAYDGISAWKLVSQYAFDLIILDLIIPGINGLDLCSRIKKTRPDIPILILSALGTTDDKVTGFECGANDYLVKPFEFRELLVRVRNLIKTSAHKPGPLNKLVFDDLELDLDKKDARRAGMHIELTAREFALLEYFMRNRGRVLSRNDIAEKVWDASFDFGTNVVDVYVNFLRKKIDRQYEKKLIHTKVGFGYIFGEQ
jgi:two-component system, OmpR family, copper resistance phosphate regulon response regulator CusR